MDLKVLARSVPVALTLMMHPYWAHGFEGTTHVGIENVIATPYFTRNVAVWDEGTLFGSSITQNFDWDPAYAPRIEFGYESTNGNGVRIAYWLFDGSSRFSRTEQGLEDLRIDSALIDAESFLDVVGTVTGTHEIELLVIDCELTHRSEMNWGYVFGGAGMRYADLDQSAVWTDSGSPQFLIVRHGFQGIGPTLSGEAGLPLFGTNVSAFASARGAMLFGTRDTFLTDDFAGDIVSDYQTVMPVIESQIGLSWNSIINGYGVQVAGAIEAQHWQRGGAASGGDDEGTPADQLDLGFFGGVLSLTLSR